MRITPPVLEPRSEDEIARELAAAAPAFAPGWQPGAGGAGDALLRVFARFARALADRINAAPDKNRLAFFEQLGIELAPAQAARAPVVFEPLAHVGDARVPARTRLGAPAPEGDGAAPLVFETEEAIALVAAPLEEVVTLWPARDAYADHSAAAAAREPFTLFQPLRPVPHELYLAHDIALALSGRCTVELEVELSTAGSAPLTIAWEFWDGELWRGFKPFVSPARAKAADSVDATAGLTRSGVIRLVSECAASARTGVNGIDALWLRGRLTEPLPPDSGLLPHVARLRIRTTIDRSLPAGSCASLSETAGLLPDRGIGAARTLDFTKAVQPLGAYPQAGDAFYLACDEALSKPGAEVTLCFTRVETASEVIDQHDAEYEEDANNAERTVAHAALSAALTVYRAGMSVLEIVRRDQPLSWPLPTPLPPVYAELGNAADELLDVIGPAIAEVGNAMDKGLGIDLQKFVDPLAERARAVAYWLRNVNTNELPPGGDDWEPFEGVPTPPLPLPAGSQPPKRETGLEEALPFDGATDDDWPWPKRTTEFLNAAPKELEAAAKADRKRLAERLAEFITSNDGRVRRAGSFIRDAALSANVAVERLDTLTPIDAVRASGIVPPPMPEPVIAWEYWDGRRWRALAVEGTAEARTFRGSGPVRFEVPADLEPTEVNGEAARWVRARLLEGGYGTVRLVSWRDEKTQRLNFFPIVQVRPPTLDKVRLGYRYVSPRVLPERCLAYNDFRYTDRSAALRERGDPFPPFEPVEDRAPALYLGFGGALPADRVTVYADIEEVPGAAPGAPAVWEAYDGARWLPVEAEDGTAALTLPGIVAAQWPGAAVEPGTLARFGTPRTWLRARLAADGTPHMARVHTLRPNAVWASHTETLEGQRLGSSTGQPEQVLFTRVRPVLPGEVLEVRELEGARAHVEEPILRAELAAAGVREDEIRVDTDVRTGRTSAVWVRWRRRPTLLFASPGERAYAIEHSRGRVLFGGGRGGRIPPPGADSIRFRTLRTGGGARGNVPQGAITQVLAGVLAAGVRNERPADGGADVESLDQLRRRAPAVVRHRSQAVSAADYEALALQASPAVAVARALPHTHPSGRPAPGWVTLRIVPHSAEARPVASFELRERVRRYLAARAPAAIATRITVLPADYLAVGVAAAIRASDRGAAAEARDAVLAALRRFLHPLHGGPDGLGWPFGRDVHLSDVAALLESLPEVDYVAALALEETGTPAGDRLAVPPDRLVVAGPLRVTLAGAEA